MNAFFDELKEYCDRTEINFAVIIADGELNEAFDFIGEAEEYLLDIRDMSEKEQDSSLETDTLYIEPITVLEEDDIPSLQTGYITDRGDKITYEEILDAYISLYMIQESVKKHKQEGKDV